MIGHAILHSFNRVSTLFLRFMEVTFVVNTFHFVLYQICRDEMKVCLENHSNLRFFVAALRAGIVSVSLLLDLFWRLPFSMYTLILMNVTSNQRYVCSYKATLMVTGL